MIATNLNISVWLIDLTRVSPRLVSSWEVLRKRVEFPGFVIIHPLRFLLNWHGPVRFMDLESEWHVTNTPLTVRGLPWVDSGTHSEASPSRSSPSYSCQKPPVEYVDTFRTEWLELTWVFLHSLNSMLELPLSKHVAYVMNSVAHMAFTFLKKSMEQLVTSLPSFRHFLQENKKKWVDPLRDVTAHLGSWVSLRQSMNSLFWTSHTLPRCMAPALRDGVPRGTSSTVSSASEGNQMSLVRTISSLQTSSWSIFRAMRCKG